MQIGRQVHQLKIPFKLEITPGKMLERFVNVWLIYGKNICLIDSGVAGSKELIFHSLRQSGREPREISLLLLTHAHPDHVGGAVSLQKAVGFKIAAHEGDKLWIEDTELQFNERPIPDFHKIVEGPVKVDRVLPDGDSLSVADGDTLKVIHTPGHSKGHLSFWYPVERLLFCGDCVPVPGDLPIYEDVAALVRSIKALKSIPGVDLLLSSWDEPRRGPDITRVIQRGLSYIQRIHQAVRDARANGITEPPAVAAFVSEKLFIRGAAANPLFARTIAAHLQVADVPNLLEIQD